MDSTAVAMKIRFGTTPERHETHQFQRTHPTPVKHDRGARAHAPRLRAYDAERLQHDQNLVWDVDMMMLG